MTKTEIQSPRSSLADVVRVRQRSIRSIHVVQDLENAAIIDEYLLTAQSRSTLSRILERVFRPSPTRAWTLTGPYGSGKSYFSLVLMNLFCPSQPGHKHAMALLHAGDAALAGHLEAHLDTQHGHGLLAVPVAGTRHPLQHCLQISLLQALEPFAQNENFQSLLADLHKWDVRIDSDGIMEWIGRLQATFHRSQLPYNGILFILDEMGKLLEFAASNPDQTDVFLFQELAERANRSGDFPVLFIGILHQGFERYASSLNSSVQREWAKVQGRFEDIAFQEPPVLQMRLIVRALEEMGTGQRAQLELLNKMAEETWWSGWQPSLLSQDQYHELCMSAYPFHPTALVAMPHIFKRLAQNERSLFAYLASSEPYGFQEFLHKNTVPALLRLPYLFDYLVANFQVRLYASNRARQLTETLERINSTPNLQQLETDLLKTIGLISWLSEIGSIRATEAAVISALRGSEYSEEELQKGLKRLKERALLVFRRFNGTYNIWQGSDVDVEERLDAAHRQLGGTFSFAETIQNYLTPRPLVARRNSYETGTLRAFEIRYVDSLNYQAASLEPKSGAAGLVLLALPATPADFAIFRSWATSPVLSQEKRVVVGIAGRSLRLADLAQELRALKWVENFENTPDLRSDPVARRELRTRIAGVEALINAELDAHLKLHRLSEAQGCEWFWQGQAIQTQGQNGLSHLLSNFCDQIFSQSPIIWNELVNRRNLSSQAAGARRNLIEAMLQHSGVENLGIEGYPPERSMYETLLKKSGLHACEGGDWALADVSDSDPLRIKPVWDAMAAYIFKPPVSPRSVSELYTLLENAPFGLASGVVPVLFCAFLAAHSAETTLYREGSLLPEPGVADWEVLLRRPDLFAVAGCRVQGSMQKILERMSHGLGVAPAVMPVVRTLVRRLKSLPEYAWRTQKLSKEALSVRHLIETAHSPERLLFHDLPVALHLLPFDEQLPKEEDIQSFFTRLNDVLEELSNVTPQLQAWARDMLLSACGVPVGIEGWEQLRNLSAKMVSRVNNTALIPLLRRASEGQNSQLALDSVLAFIANRPLRTWSDNDAERFVPQATALGELFQEARINFLPAADLSAQQQQRCREIAVRVRDAVKTEFGNDSSLLQAALQALAHELSVHEARPSVRDEELP